MPYQVKSGSFTVVAATLRQALELFDRLVEDGVDKVNIQDMHGAGINPEAIRRALACEE